MRSMVFLLLPVVVFPVTIGSYLPNSLNDLIHDMVFEKIGVDVNITRVVEGISYDGILSPFKEEGFKFSEKLFGVVPVVFLRKGTDRVVMPLRYLAVGTLFLSTFDEIPYDLTSFVFPKEAEDLVIRLREMKKEGKLIPVFCADPKEALLIALRSGYGFVGPSYMKSSLPLGYKAVSFDEYFSLSKPPVVTWIYLYHNGGVEINRVLGALLRSQEIFKKNGLIPPIESERYRTLNYRCPSDCGKYILTFSYKLFFTDEDPRNLLREYGNSFERSIWYENASDPLYFSTYLLIGLLMLFTLVYKMFVYIRRIRLGDLKFSAFPFFSSVYFFTVSLFGTLPFVDFNPSKVFYYLPVISYTILDFISKKRRWYLTPILGTAVLILSLTNDRWISLVDAPFLFTVLSFITERDPLRAFFIMIGLLSFFAVKRSSHVFYLVPSLILLSALISSIVVRRVKTGKAGKYRDLSEYRTLIFGHLYSILALFVFSIFLTFFLDYVETEKTIERLEYDRRFAALRNITDLEYIEFPVAQMTLPGVLVKNSLEFDEIEAQDKGILVSRRKGAFLSFVSYKRVVLKALSENVGYILTILILFVMSGVVYAFASGYEKVIDREILTDVKKMEDEIESLKEVSENLERKLKGSKKMIKGMIESLEKPVSIREFLIRVAEVLKDSELFEECIVAEMFEDGWTSIYPERNSKIKVPIPDMKPDSEGRISMSVKRDGKIYALVLKTKEADMDVLETIYHIVQTLPKYPNLSRILMKIIDEKMGIEGFEEKSYEIATMVSRKMDVDIQTLKSALLMRDIGFLFDLKDYSLHPRRGWEILKDDFEKVAEIVRSHHGCEECDEIPKEARLIQAVDHLTERVLKGGKLDEVLREMEESGKFDEGVLRVLKEMKEDIRRVLK